nr:HK97-gp10_like tail component [uncultured Mediterranean phage uvMED]BAR38598.1 HK97-gp10_like tail component [uncultured Mediterranean phage uvMED]
MAKARGIENIGKDLNSNLERDFNILLRTIITDLSTEQYSAVDTGFFASSWTASTQRPRPDQSRKDHSPWSNIKPSRNGTKASGAVVEPRFLDKLSFNFKSYSKVFVGNRSEYAARALASPRSGVPQYVQGELNKLIKQTFTDKPKLAVGTYGSGVKYESKNVRELQGFGLFGGTDDVFVDYTNP